MEFIIFILIIIIVILSFYLILLKKEIKRTSKNLKNLEKESSNVLLNKEFNDSSINDLIIQINALLKSINEKEIAIKVKDKSLQKMITNIAHDLRTPLTSAIGYIDMIKSENLTSKEKAKYISIIEERLNKLSYLITNFFDFSKVISKNEEIELQKQNIVEILENCIANYYEDFSKNNRGIDLSCNEQKIELYTNKALLIRIFDNLIINAYKHSNSDLKINIIKIGKTVQLEFINKLEDKSLDIDSIFDEFYTADISRTKGNTGLGLAIVKEFVQLLNGKIYAIKDNEVLKIVLEFTAYIT